MWSMSDFDTDAYARAVTVMRYICVMRYVLRVTHLHKYTVHGYDLPRFGLASDAGPAADRRRLFLAVRV